MKKLHIVLACSLLAACCQKNLQALGLGKGKPTEATKKTVDPAKENKNAKKNNAQIETENDIANREKLAKNSAIESGQRVAEVVNEEAIKKQADAISKQAQNVFRRRNQEAQNASNMPEGTAKESAIKETTRNSINDALEGKNLPEKKFNEIETEAIKKSKSWSETWNESSFKQWIDTIVESVTQFVNKMSKPFTSSSGFTFSEDGATIGQPNLAQQSAKGKETQQPINLSEQSSPINSATSDLYRNIEKTADVAATSDQLASDSKAYADTAAKTKTDLAAKNTWFGALGL